MLKTLLFLITLCTGCLNINQPLVDLNSSFALDSSFSPEEQEEIVKALWDWEQATNGIVNMGIIVTDTPNLYSSNPKIIKSQDWSENLASTISTTTNTNIFIYYKVIESKYNYTHVSLQSIAEHEMGHAFGLKHASHGVMMAAAPDQRCIDNFTLEQFCETHHCSMDEVHTTCIE